MNNYLIIFKIRYIKYKIFTTWGWSRGGPPGPNIALSLCATPKILVRIQKGCPSVIVIDVLEFGCFVHSCLIWSDRCVECWCLCTVLSASWLQHNIHVWDWRVRDSHWDQGLGRELHASTDMWQVITDLNFSLLPFVAVNSAKYMEVNFDVLRQD